MTMFPLGENSIIETAKTTHQQQYQTILLFFLYANKETHLILSFLYYPYQKDSISIEFIQNAHENKEQRLSPCPFLPSIIMVVLQCRLYAFVSTLTYTIVVIVFLLYIGRYLICKTNKNYLTTNLEVFHLQILIHLNE